MNSKNDKFIDAELLDDKATLPAQKDDRAEVMVQPSGIPWVNKINELKVKSYRKVIQETTGLLGDLKDHQRALEDLRSVDLDIEADRLTKQARLDELREITECNDQLKGQRQRIEKKALDLQEAELDRRLKEYK